jgi:hypothetical protein
MNANIKSFTDFRFTFPDISIRNVLFFLAAILIDFSIHINVWVIEMSDLSMVIILIIWFTRRKKLSRERAIIRRFRGIIHAFWLLVAWCIATQIFALDEVSVSSVSLMILRTLKWILYGMIFIVLITEFVSGKSSIHYIFNGFVFGIALQGLLLMFGIGQRPEDVMKSEEQQYEKTRGYYRKEALGSQNPNETGSMTACYLVFLIPALLRYKKVKNSKILIVIVKYALPVTITFSLLFLLYSGLSRGAMLTAAFGLLLIYANSRRKMAMSIVIFALGIYVLNSDSLRARMETRDRVMGHEKKDDRTGGRVVLPIRALTNEIDSRGYLIGKGFYGRFYVPDMWIDGAHNNYVQILWETGIIGLLLFLHIFYRFFRYFRRIPDPDLRKHLFIMLFTLLFTILPGEFLYYGPYLCAQVVLLTYATLNYDKRLLEIGVPPQIKPVLETEVNLAPKYI